MQLVYTRVKDEILGRESFRVKKSESVSGPEGGEMERWQ